MLGTRQSRADLADIKQQTISHTSTPPAPPRAAQQQHGINRCILNERGRPTQHHRPAPPPTTPATSTTAQEAQPPVQPATSTTPQTQPPAKERAGTSTVLGKGVRRLQKTSPVWQYFSGFEPTPG